jgi:hypothetical protein
MLFPDLATVTASDLASEFARSYPGLSVDEMLCDWPTSYDFCRRLGIKFNLPDGHGPATLRDLLHIRKHHRHLLPPTVPKPAERMDARLAVAWPDVDPTTFRDTIRSTYLDLHSTEPVEHVLCDWRRAAKFCEVVTDLLGRERLVESDGLILRTLLNMRRQGGLNARERSGGRS